MIAALFAISLALAGYTYWSFRTSEQSILRELETIGAQASELSAEQCVDAVLTWTGRCGATQTLCESSAARMMLHCLAGRDRLAYCKGIEANATDTRFGNPQCKARGATKGMARKACGHSYRAIAAFCQRVLKAHKATPKTGPARG